MTGTRSQRSFPTSRAPSALASSGSSPMPGTRATTHRPTSASKSTWRVRGEGSPPPSNARAAGAQREPALVLLAHDVGLAGLALSVERVEVLLEPLLRGLARVDGAANAGAPLRGPVMRLLAHPRPPRQ